MDSNWSILRGMMLESQSIHMLKSTGASQCMQELGDKSCKADPDL